MPPTPLLSGSRGSPTPNTQESSKGKSTEDNQCLQSVSSDIASKANINEVQGCSVPFSLQKGSPEILLLRAAPPVPPIPNSPKSDEEGYTVRNVPYCRMPYIYILKGSRLKEILGLGGLLLNELYNAIYEWRFRVRSDLVDNDFRNITTLLQSVYWENFGTSVGVFYPRVNDGFIPHSDLLAYDTTVQLHMNLGQEFKMHDNPQRKLTLRHVDTTGLPKYVRLTLQEKSEWDSIVRLIEEPLDMALANSLNRPYSLPQDIFDTPQDLALERLW